MVRSGYILHVMILVLAASFLSTHCSSTRKFLETDVVADSEKNYGSAEDGTLDGLGKAFHKAVATGDIADLEAYYPDAAVARHLSPKETGQLSDESIETDMIAPMIDRLKKNIDIISNDAVSKGLETGNIEFRGIAEQPKTDPGQPVDVASVKMGTGSYEADVPVTYAMVDDRAYIFEVLFATDIFKSTE